MTRRGSLFSLAALALAVFLALPAAATDYFIRTDGNDSNTGLSNTPGGAWKTFGKIRFGSYNPGDVINIAQGTYLESGSYGINHAGIIIRGSTPIRPELQDMALEINDVADNLRLENLVLNDRETHLNIVIVRNGVSNLALVGCDLLNPKNLADVDSHGGLVFESVNGLTVDHCKFLNQPLTAASNRFCNVGTMDLAAQSTGVAFTDCEFNLNPPAGSQLGSNIAINNQISNVTITGCTFVTAPASNIAIAGSGGTTPTNTYSNWLVRDNGFQRTVWAGASFSVGAAHNLVNWTVQRNVWRNSVDQAFYVAGAGTVIDGLVLLNNSFEDVGAGLISVTGDANVLLDQCVLAPTLGRETRITNNTFKNTRGVGSGGWAVTVRGNGPGPIIADNHFINMNEAHVVLNGGITFNVGDPVQGMVGASVTGNISEGDLSWGAVVVRHEVGGTGTIPGITRNTLIENNLITDCAQYGISIESNNHINPMVRYNDVFRCGAGIQTSAPTVIVGNEVYNNTLSARAGIWLNVFRTAPADFAFTNVAGSIVTLNLAAQCAGFGIAAATQLTTRAGNVDIYNNTVVRGRDGILIGVDGLDVYNNIIAYNTGRGLVWAATTEGVLGYNLHFNTVSGGQNFSGFPGSTSFPGDQVGVNPKFVDIFALNFHLDTGSPAIGASALLVGGSLIPSGGDLGAYPTGMVSAGVPPSAWELYR